MKIFTALLTLLLLVSVPQTLASANDRQFEAGVIIDLLDSQGNKIGNARFTEFRNKGVKIHVEASQLSPGVHAIHIHEFGKCDPPDFTTAGAHFNPDGKKHGFNNPEGFHNGDLPNLVVGNDGKVVADIETEAITLEEGHPNSILRPGGTSLIIHEKVDDYQTDPSGNSGGRIACGVIK